MFHFQKQVHNLTSKYMYFLYKLLSFRLILFFYLYLAVLGLLCCTGFSLVVASGDCSPAVVWGLLLGVASLVLEPLGPVGFSSCCGARAQSLRFLGSRAQAQQLWHLGLVPPRRVGSSWIRDWTRVSCTGRWILYCWATRETLV